MRSIGLIIVAGCLVCVGCEKQQQAVKVSKQGEQSLSAGQAEQTKTQSGQARAAGHAGDIEVSVRILTVDERDFNDLDSLWYYTTSSFVVTRRPDIFPESGLKVQMASGNLTRKVAAVAKEARYTYDRPMTLVLADGATGYVKIGTGIPVQRFHYLTRSYEATDYNFSSVVREFKVTGRRIPYKNLVNLRFIPVLSRFLSNGGDKEFPEMTTSVTVEPGRSILIGGDRSLQRSLASVLLGVSTRGRQIDTVILVNVSLL
jgi:hypothetical protein